MSEPALEDLDYPAWSLFIGVDACSFGRLEDVLGPWMRDALDDPHYLIFFNRALAEEERGPHKDAPMTTRSKTPAPINFSELGLVDVDPWPTAQPGHPTNAITDPPAWWTWHPKQTRARLFSVITLGFERHGDLGSVLRFVRDAIEAQSAAGDSIAAGVLHTWGHPSGNTDRLLGALFRKLAAAGGALPLLREQQKAIQTQIDFLEQLLAVKK